MTLAWGPDLPRLFAAVTGRETLTSVRVDFVHGSATTPFYTVVFQNATLGQLKITYDSAAASWLEDVTVTSRDVSYPSQMAQASGKTLAIMPHRNMMVATPRIMLSTRPQMLHVFTDAGDAGTPTSAFVTFTPVTGSLPSETPQAQAHNATSGMQLFELVVTERGYFPLTFAKNVGSASPALQDAFAHQRTFRSVVFDFMDGSPGRSAYRVTLAPASAMSARTSMVNGSPRQSLTMDGAKVTIEDLVSHVSATGLRQAIP